MSWAVPSGHGTWRGLDLDLLDPGDDDDLQTLIEALHECGDLPWTGPEQMPPGQPGAMRLHVAMHQIVARQIRDDGPPETWQTVQRLAGLGYTWHDIMHLIAALVTEDVHAALAGERFDQASYLRRLANLPASGSAPPPDRPPFPVFEEGFPFGEDFAAKSTG
jgi:hypothetical protein